MSGCGLAKDEEALRCISADLATRAVSAHSRKLVSNVASKSHQCFITTSPLLAVGIAQRIVKALKSITESTVGFSAWISRYRAAQRKGQTDPEVRRYYSHFTDMCLFLNKSCFKQSVISSKLLTAVRSVWFCVNV